MTTVRIGQATCTGEEFRKHWNYLQSFFFQVAERKIANYVPVESGTVVGMSQYTANQMAKEGKGYEEILQYFYEGAQLKDGGEIFLKLE